MSEIVWKCPRCKAQHITLDILEHVGVAVHHGWQNEYEAYAVCRNCHKSSILILQDKTIELRDYILRNKGPSKFIGAITKFLNIAGYISLKDEISSEPPDHLPQDIHAIFIEASRCNSIGCFNAAGTMYRLCLDLATKSLLPEQDENGLNRRTRRDLGLRLPWLFENGRLPIALQELSSCVKDDGNDGAHAGTLTREDADDLHDFSVAILERLFTEPRRLELAKERRAQRRAAT